MLANPMEAGPSTAMFEVIDGTGLQNREAPKSPLPNTVCAYNVANNLLVVVSALGGPFP
jgi:hypothetical protein